MITKILKKKLVSSILKLKIFCTFYCNLVEKEKVGCCKTEITFDWNRKKVSLKDSFHIFFAKYNLINED